MRIETQLHISVLAVIQHEHLHRRTEHQIFEVGNSLALGKPVSEAAELICRYREEVQDKVKKLCRALAKNKPRRGE